MITLADRLNSVEEYYFSSKLREVRELINQGKPIINMGIGSPDLQPPQHVIDTIKNAMQDTAANQYQSYQGLPELRQEMAHFYDKHFQVNLDYNSEILPLLGSKEGIMHISLAFLNPNDGVLIPNPGYPTYLSVANLVGAKPIFYDLTEANNWEPNFTQLEQQDLSGVKLMWVNYPNMPTGAGGSLKLFEKLIAFGKKHSILIVNDNPYSFVLNDNPISILQTESAKDVALELNSFSKTYNMSGWRVGMVLGHSKFIDAILKVKSNMDSGMFYGVQKGAIEALKTEKSWINNQNSLYKKRRELVFKLADKMNCSYDKNAVGLFVWAKLPSISTDSEEFVNTLLYDKNIFIAPGTIFGSNGKGFIRFSLCINENKIQEAIDRF